MTTAALRGVAALSWNKKPVSAWPSALVKLTLVIVTVLATVAPCGAWASSGASSSAPPPPQAVRAMAARAPSRARLKMVMRRRVRRLRVLRMLMGMRCCGLRCLCYLNSRANPKTQ
jgi:hypothetical protein